MTSSKHRLGILLLLLTVISFVQCQFSLNEMIDRNSPGVRTTPPPPVFGAQLNQNLYSPNVLSNDPRYDPHASAIVAKSVLKIGRDLTNKLMEKKPNEKSYVLSPFSIASAMSLLLLGARGVSHNELAHVLGYDEDKTLASTPYKIHEEFGLHLEDLVSDYPNPNRTRAATPWKSGARVEYQSRFNFPEDTSTERRVIQRNMMQNDSPPAVNMNSRNPGGFDLGTFDDEVDHKIYIANGIFVQTGYSFRPDYKMAVESVYKSHIMGLDFKRKSSQSAAYINNWVKEKTGGKIKNIIEGMLPAETKVILANALYFKAKWEKSFLEGATQVKNFYPDGVNSPPIQVELMAHGGTFPFYESHDFGCRILGIPYKNGLSTMYVILPNNSNRGRVRELQSYLTADNIDGLIARMELKQAVILFPKMHLQSSMDLRETLSDLGVRAVFSSRSSDLSLISSGYEQFVTPMRGEAPPVDGFGETPFVFSHNDDANRKKRDVTYKTRSSFKLNNKEPSFKDFVLNKRIVKGHPDKKNYRGKRQAVGEDTTQVLKNLDVLRSQPSGINPGLYADQVLHKVDLTINEKGTEGGAATVTTISKSTQVIFRVDTPFIFLIRHDDTKLPIFYGVVVDPTN